MRYGSRVKWSNSGKGVAPSPTPQCSSYWKESLRVALDYGHQLYLLIVYMYLSFLMWASLFDSLPAFLCVFLFLFVPAFFSVTLSLLSLSLPQPSQLGLSNTLTASLQKRKTPTPTGVLNMILCWYYVEAPATELCGMGSTFSLPVLPGPLWSGMVVFVRVPSISQIGICNYFLNLKLLNWVQTNDSCLFELVLHSKSWSHLTVYK